MSESRNAKIIEEFRAGDGVVGGMFEGVPVLLLHTTGAISGEQRITPLVPLMQGERMFVFASNAGAPNHPAWFHNLAKDPQVIVAFGAGHFTATARVLDGPERDRIITRQIELYPNFAEYEQRTARTIPVVELVRAGTS
jgi:deazaflavin-dependent oxidoreductase (nitroreductase family)